MPQKQTKQPTTSPSPTSSSSGISTPPIPTPTPTPPPTTLTDSLPLPRLIVFDLDFTLWPFWVDTHVAPPLEPSPTHTSVSDRYGNSFSFYADVPCILASLRAKGVKIAAASRTQEPELGRALLRLLHLPAGDGTGNEGGEMRRALDCFDYVEIYPGTKIVHFRELRKASGVEYGDMLFFDDEERNKIVETLGVTMCLVKHGVSRSEIDDGVRQWRERKWTTEEGWEGEEGD